MIELLVLGVGVGLALHDRKRCAKGAAQSSESMSMKTELKRCIITKFAKTIPQNYCACCGRTLTKFDTVRIDAYKRMLCAKRGCK
jgi:hypothetical protein